ncbi:MAG: DUF1697 domain-containing protein [Gemmatimonadota bacterium]
MTHPGKRIVYLALLRGVNVGGNRSLPMKELARLCSDLGCGDVQTVIQSGNLVFTAGKDFGGSFAARLATELGSRFGMEVPVVVRTLPEWEKVALGNAFLERGADPATLHVAFLADRPSKRRVDALDSGRSPPDEFEVRGREIYLRCPNGLARTKLDTRYFDGALATTSTFRNWRTVLRLHEIAKGA